VLPRLLGWNCFRAFPQFDDFATECDLPEVHPDSN
jgi:hypothetical protein